MDNFDRIVSAGFLRKPPETPEKKYSQEELETKINEYQGMIEDAEATTEITKAGDTDAEMMLAEMKIEMATLEGKLNELKGNKE